ncbi:unnamed protein product [Xylocopa violacea]|uniref:G-protein coupled receptors family 2 profile 2 domain-containing protein n=1 Tax=Xylocopa violacea TaxID=135666 RepID=A0ABP1P5I6_XYLVO
MSGCFAKFLVLLHVLSYLAICIALVEDDKPIIYSIPLGNGTTIPEKYKDLPVVAKCCEVDEVLVKNDTHGAICRAANYSVVEYFSPLFHDFNNSGFTVPGDKHTSFVAIVGNPCKYSRYILDPNDNYRDTNYLLTNGSVYVPDQDPTILQPGVDYCIETVPELGPATFVCFPEDHVVMAADSRITLYACGLLISVPFLILTIVAYSITPKLRDVFGKTLCHYCGCLSLAFTTMAITQLTSIHFSDQTCTNIAFVIQFSFIACFFWLNAMCIEMWSLVRSYVDRETYQRMEPKRLFFWYSLWCWGPSALLILLSMVMHLRPTIPATYVKMNSDKESCTFELDDKSMPYFYVPIGLLHSANAVLFVLTFIKLTKYQRKLDLRRLARNRESDRLDRKFLRRLTRITFVCMIVFFLMGFNWSMELISWLVNANSFDWSSFDLVNALQGVLVFGLFVLRRPPRDFVWHRIQQLRGKNVPPEPELGSMELFLLPMTLNGNSVPRQTIIQ